MEQNAQHSIWIESLGVVFEIWMINFHKNIMCIEKLICKYIHFIIISGLIILIQCPNYVQRFHKYAWIMQQILWKHYISTFLNHLVKNIVMEWPGSHFSKKTSPGPLFQHKTQVFFIFHFSIFFLFFNHFISTQNCKQKFSFSILN